MVLKMKKFAVGAIVLVTLTIGGCATAPENIAPAYVSNMQYQSWTCDQMAAESGRLASALVAASTQQSKARSNDTIGVIFLGLPVSSLSGSNVAPEIARLKGEQAAIQQAQTLKNCGSGAAAAAR
jgi:outer membrane murein-binding lipoprotein Lpp